MKLRTPESVKRMLDAMTKRGPVVLDHGICAYTFDHYDYQAPSVHNDFRSSIAIFYQDFDLDKTVKLFMILTENDLRVPTKDDVCCYLTCCEYEKKYPQMLYLKEYQVW